MRILTGLTYSRDHASKRPYSLYSGRWRSPSVPNLGVGGFLIGPFCGHLGLACAGALEALEALGDSADDSEVGLCS